MTAKRILLATVLIAGLVAALGAYRAWHAAREQEIARIVPTLRLRVITHQEYQDRPCSYLMPGVIYAAEFGTERETYRASRPGSARAVYAALIGGEYRPFPTPYDDSGYNYWFELVDPPSTGIRGAAERRLLESVREFYKKYDIRPSQKDKGWPQVAEAGLVVNPGHSRNECTMGAFVQKAISQELPAVSAPGDLPIPQRIREAGPIEVREVPAEDRGTWSYEKVFVVSNRDCPSGFCDIAIFGFGRGKYTELMRTLGSGVHNLTTSRSTRKTLLLHYGTELRLLTFIDAFDAFFVGGCLDSTQEDLSELKLKACQGDERPTQTSENDAAVPFLGVRSPSPFDTDYAVVEPCCGLVVSGSFPGPFDLRTLELQTARRSSNDHMQQVVTHVPLTGSLKTGSQEYPFVSRYLHGSRFVFDTEDVAGTRYAFEGQFVQAGEFRGKQPKGVVLTGTLKQITHAGAVSPAPVQFTYRTVIDE